MSDFLIRRATLADASTLGDVAFASKAHWGYDAAFMERVRPGLAPPRENLEGSHYYLAERAGEVAGFYGLTEREGQPWLEDLWVRPAYIGTGLGRQLWEHLVQTAAGLGHVAFEFSSDPHAEGFYLRMGARRIGELVAQTTGRSLPRLRFEVPGLH